jgi:glycosyltransferase involved in cell wall biosynthesis
LRILHVVPSYHPAVRYGGTIYAVHGLAAGAARRGHEVHVYTTNVDGLESADVPLGRPVDLEGVRVWYFATDVGRRIYRSLKMGEALRSNIKDFQIIHLHSVFLWPTTVAARVAWNTGPPAY